MRSNIDEFGVYVNQIVAWSANAEAGIQIPELPGWSRLVIESLVPVEDYWENG